MPAAGAATRCSIFIASMTASVWPARTRAPSSTSTAAIRPSIGARAGSAPGSSPGCVAKESAWPAVACPAGGLPSAPAAEPASPADRADRATPVAPAAPAAPPARTASRTDAAISASRAMPASCCAMRSAASSNTGIFSSTKRVCTALARTSGASSSASSSARLVCTPSMRNSASARRARASASAWLPAACTTSLAKSESKRGLGALPARAAVSTRTPGPPGGSNTASVPEAGWASPSGRGTSALMRTCTAWPRGAQARASSRPSAPSGSPAARRSCACTRSTPVTISVTVCSTCRRGLASMNQKPPSSLASPPSSPARTRNSKVPMFS